MFVFSEVRALSRAATETAAPEKIVRGGGGIFARTGENKFMSFCVSVSFAFSDCDSATNVELIFN